MNRLSYKYVFRYYFVITAFFGLLDMLSIHLFEYNYILTLVLIVCGFHYFKKNNIEQFDLVVIFTIALISILGYSRNPHKDLYSIGLLWEVIPMLAFFIGKDKSETDNSMFHNGIVGVIITCVLGLMLYIVQPGWYLAFRLSILDNVTEYSWLEMTRLSAFWQYPYWISYGAAIIYTYILGEYIIDGRYKNRITFVILFFLFMISLLTQQRVSIGGIVLATIVYIVLYKGLKRKCISSTILYCIIIIISLYATYYIMSSFLDVSRLDFMFSKFEALNDSNSNFLSNRIEIFDNMNDISICWFGDGLGLYSHGAYAKGLTHYITDHGYMKMLYETGFVGFSLRLFIILCSLHKGLTAFKYNHIECIVMIMIMLSLFGANSLSSIQMHNIVFWFCCGRVWNKHKKSLIK